MNDTEFRRGYYTAVANLVRRFDEPTIAADILRQYGAEVDLSNIDGDDAAEIRWLAALENIPIKLSPLIV